MHRPLEPHLAHTLVITLMRDKFSYHLGLLRDNLDFKLLLEFYLPRFI